MTKAPLLEFDLRCKSCNRFWLVLTNGGQPAASCWACKSLDVTSMRRPKRCLTPREEAWKRLFDATDASAKIQR